MRAIAPTQTELAQQGVPSAARVAAALVAGEDVLPGGSRGAIVAGLARAADPLQAAHGLVELLRAVPADPAVVDVEALVVVLGGSAALRATLVAAGAEWPRFAADMGRVTARRDDEHAARLAPALDAGTGDREDVQRILRRYVQREEVRIGGRDLVGAATVDETMRELSALAEAVVAAALRATRARLEETWPGTADLPFVVFGMGKLGGRELNYSSDVDLVYVYEDGGPLPDDRTHREFFGRVAEELTRTLSEVTADGFCYRVDLRLRPAGNEGPIAIALPGLLSYYESWGQTWERAVWLKARPIAGDVALGARVLAELEPFIYRRYLDFGTLEALKAMKDRVDASLRDRDHRRRNVKLGRGGIREVEFLVQAQQLVHGGKDARLRERGTLAVLDRLAGTGYVRGEVRDALAAAYRFLRDVEHKLQIVHRRQTQTIPASEEDVRALARRLGFLGADGVDRFWEAHARHTGCVRRAFEDLFRGDEDATESDAGSAAIVSLLDPLATPARLAATLGELGFADPEQAGRDLALLINGPPRAPASDRRRVAMERLGPALLAEIVASADRDRALASMATFLSSVGARTSYLHLLAEKPGVRGLLVRLFASSEFLSRYFLKSPELLEALVRVDLVRVAPTEREEEVELADRLAAAASLEAELDVIRRFHHEELLRIGIHDLEGALMGVDVEAQLTALATVCLRAAVAIARRDVCRRRRVPDTPTAAGLAVIGMGKLGGRELAYGSDLDLVFVWEVPPGSSWPGPVAPLEFYTRVVQGTISTLQTQTTEGYAYKIDTRLRPSGNQGTLVTSLEGFEEYHRRSAAVWERQALVKARVVAGPEVLADRVAATIEAFVYGSSLTEEEAAEIRRIRRRMEQERGSGQSIKTGQGGVADVEFAVQVLQLRHGHADPALRTPSTRQALAALADATYVASDVVAALADGYAFLRRLEHRLRIERDQPGDSVPEDPGARLRLARRLGYDGAEADAVRALAADLARHRDAIRRAYASVVGGDADAP
jgi:glutamate-ammonia-ligase adenylyltransferase